MSIFVNVKLNRLTLVLLVFALSACQTPPKPVPTPLPAPVLEPISPPVAETASVPQRPEVAETETQPLPNAVEEISEDDLDDYHDAVDDLKDSDIEDAIEGLLEVSRNAPQIPHVYTNLGLAYFNLGSYEQAEKAFRFAIDLNGDDAVAYNHLGIVKRMQGDFEGAKQDYQKAINLNSNYATAYLNLGILYDIYLQDLELALQQYKIYQTLSNNKNELVTEWITDLQRRITSGQTERE